MSDKEVTYGNMPASVLEALRKSMCRPEPGFPAGSDYHYKEFLAYGLPVLVERWPETVNETLVSELAHVKNVQAGNTKSLTEISAIVRPASGERLIDAVKRVVARGTSEGPKSVPTQGTTDQTCGGVSPTTQLIAVIKAQNLRSTAKVDEDLRTYIKAARSALGLDLAQAAKALAPKEGGPIANVESNLAMLEEQGWDTLNPMGDILAVLVCEKYALLLRDKVLELIEKI